jgi:hypothetical protein
MPVIFPARLAVVSPPRLGGKGGTRMNDSPRYLLDLEDARKKKIDAFWIKLSDVVAYLMKSN